uniref:Uncharacterized protein n=1 Tax=Arundo donax TaxID=35708 RepID=A0A0A9AA02_ARUDO
MATFTMCCQFMNTNQTIRFLHSICLSQTATKPRKLIKCPLSKVA